MWQRIKKNFDSGIKKIKWFSSLISNRLNIEISIIKLLYQSEQLSEKRDELMRIIGKRFYELKDQPEKNILKDRIINESLKEIEAINSKIESTIKKASELSNIDVKQI
jgi:thymidylate synthase ThyX